MRKAILFIAVFVGIFSACQKGQAPPAQEADLVIRNARVYTVDPQHPWA